ncbi:hypothetical protein ADUPG1_013320 [Aduncisulcus paluster]|uniref:Uncharacterized protein n=1 Tax=Aduncisulcus paluster TaxID=2918883 RepID=A0ABQ5K2I5_9EUKA|nr:hypothetical protein ADUPG1_013320 [Aduncisulcus paluster]
MREVNKSGIPCVPCSWGRSIPERSTLRSCRKTSGPECRCCGKPLSLVYDPEIDRLTSSTIVKCPNHDKEFPLQTSKVVSHFKSYHKVSKIKEFIDSKLKEKVEIAKAPNPHSKKIRDSKSIFSKQGVVRCLELMLYSLISLLGPLLSLFLPTIGKGLAIAFFVSYLVLSWLFVVLSRLFGDSAWVFLDHLLYQGLIGTLMAFFKQQAYIGGFKFVYLSFFTPSLALFFGSLVFLFYPPDYSILYDNPRMVRGIIHGSVVFVLLLACYIASWWVFDIQIDPILDSFSYFYHWQTAIGAVLVNLIMSIEISALVICHYHLRDKDDGEKYDTSIKSAATQYFHPIEISALVICHYHLRDKDDGEKYDTSIKSAATQYFHPFWIIQFMILPFAQFGAFVIGPILIGVIIVLALIVKYEK